MSFIYPIPGKISDQILLNIYHNSTDLYTSVYMIFYMFFEIKDI